MTKKRTVKKIVNNNHASIYSSQMGDSPAIFTVKKEALISEDADHSQPADKNDNTYPIAMNGETNMRPKETIDKARKIPAIEAALQKRAELFYSAGWHFGKLIYGNNEDQGTESFLPVKDMKVRSWLRRTNWDQYTFNAAKELGWWNLCFVEIVMDRVAKEVAQVLVHKNPHCRFTFNNKLGRYTHCLISPNWEGTEIPKGAIKIDVLDPVFDVAGQVRKSKKKRFIYPLFQPSVLETYYPMAPWQLFLATDWYEIAVAIAAMNKSIVNNSTISYHIEISEAWFDWKWPNFNEYPAAKKDSLTKEAIQVFIDAMSGTDNAGNIFTSVKMLNAEQSEEFSSWTVNVIDNKYKDGVHLPTSQEAYQHLYLALGMDRSILGPVPGGSGLNNGSGSEKRVANNIQLSSQKYEADLIFKVFDLVRDINNWDPELIMRIRQESITTLDQGKETQVGEKPLDKTNKEPQQQAS